MEERTCSGFSALHLAAFYCYRHSYERAHSLIARVIRQQPTDTSLKAQAEVALAWLLLQQQQHAVQMEGAEADAAEVEQAAGLFSRRLEEEPGDLQVCSC